MARSRYDAAAADPGQASAINTYDDGKRDAVVANVLWVTGAVLVVAAGVWLVVRASTPKATAVAAPGAAFAFSAPRGCPRASAWATWW